MAGVLDQEETSELGGLNSYSGFVTKYWGQSVTAGIAEEVLQVDLNIAKVGSPTGNISVEIWSEDGAGKPLAKVSNTGTHDISTLTTSYVWTSILIPASPTYAIGNKFCIVVYYDGGDSSNYLKTYTGSNYAGGIGTYSGDAVTWTENGSSDLDFKTYMGEYIPPVSAPANNMSLLGIG